MGGNTRVWSNRNTEWNGSGDKSLDRYEYRNAFPAKLLLTIN